MTLPYLIQERRRAPKCSMSFVASATVCGEGATQRPMFIASAGHEFPQARPGGCAAVVGALWHGFPAQSRLRRAQSMFSGKEVSDMGKMRRARVIKTAYPPDRGTWSKYSGHSLRAHPRSMSSSRRCGRSPAGSVFGVNFTAAPSASYDSLALEFYGTRDHAGLNISRLGVSRSCPKQCHGLGTFLALRSPRGAV